MSANRYVNVYDFVVQLRRRQRKHRQPDGVQLHISANNYIYLYITCMYYTYIIYIAPLATA